MLSVITVFCEDIREEKAGTITVIGIFTDNIQVEKFPVRFPKLCMYTRISIPIEDELPKQIVLTASHTDGSSIPLTTFDEKIIQTSAAEARAIGASAAGLIGTAILGLFLVKQAGRMTVIANIDGKERTCGTLNIQAAIAASA